MKPNAIRMQSAVDFVGQNPGTLMRPVIACVLDTFAEMQRGRPGAYKQAQAVVERIVKDRHVRQEGDRLFPWDVKRRTFAEALERAVFAAPTTELRVLVLPLATEAWRAAGDENRARMLETLERAAEADGTLLTCTPGRPPSTR